MIVYPATTASVQEEHHISSQNPSQSTSVAKSYFQAYNPHTSSFTQSQ